MSQDQIPEKTVFVPRSTGQMDLFQAGDTVGQYKVEKVLGAGGMGVVYLVQHTALKKHFALKALPATLAQDKAFVGRFKREAEMLGRLKHAHIVNVTDFGENQGRLYLVLEYVDGGSLEEWFHQHAKAGGAPPAEVRRLLSQVLQGLGHAHKAGIVHRDLKPANVLLEKNGEAKISDFGLARVVEEEEYRRGGGTASPFHGDSVSTTGAIVGTIDFMSPEARNMRPSDARSDIYAVGVMAYYLLTGSKPHGMAQPASRKVAGLDPRWDKFIATCLAEDPQKRFQNAEAALENLQQVQRSAGPAKWMAPVALVALIGAAAGIWLWQKPTPQGPMPPAEKAPLTEAKPLATDPTPEPLPQVAKPAAPQTRKLVLVKLPVGSVVTGNGRNFTAGAAGRVVLDLLPGAQPVKIHAPGYMDWEGEVGAAEGQLEESVMLEQVPPHAVTFTSLPPGAQVKVGDESAAADAKGTFVLQLRPGKLQVSATARKFEDLSSTVEVHENTAAIALEMKRLPPPAEVMVTLDGGVAVRFKLIRAGRGLVGSSPEEPGRQRSDLARSEVEIPRDFYMAETEMTQAAHRTLAGKNPSVSRVLPEHDKLPVEQVAWRDITKEGGVLEKLNTVLRKLELPYLADLPTEIEWEYACRAGTTSGFNDGSELRDQRNDPALNALAHYYRVGSKASPSPVGKLKPNAWGLFDMLGNISEWAYGPKGSRDPRDPVQRGGNWRLAPPHCRSASRVELTPDTRPTDTMGYRLVLRPTEE